LEAFEAPISFSAEIKSKYLLEIERIVMKRGMLLLLMSTLTLSVFAGNVRKTTMAVPSNFSKIMDRTAFEINPENEIGTALPSIRNAVLIDSSKNGYGMVMSETSPISWKPGTDYLTMAYRQWAGSTGPSGVIGMAVSDDRGGSWLTLSNVNNGTEASNYNGRYPSAISTEFMPIVLWNEYGGGGGDYGGRGYYTFDEGEYFSEALVAPIDIHNSPSDNDSWAAIASYNTSAAGDDYFNVIFADWSNDRDRINFHASTTGSWYTEYLDWSNANILLANSVDFVYGSDGSNYTANGTIDINDEGYGFYVTSSYWADDTEVANHTLFIKKTTDFGATWSDWYWLDDATTNDYFHPVFPDSLYDEDTGEWTALSATWAPFISYEVETLVDSEGNLHVFSGVLPSDDGSVYPGWSEANGLYHFKMTGADFAATGGAVPNVDIDFIGSLQLTWLYDDPGWQGNSYGAAIDVGYDQSIYVVYYGITDTITTQAGTSAYVDILANYSHDNGVSWLDTSINLTPTVDIDETYPHVAHYAESGEVYIMYQVPDYAVQTVAGDVTSAGYKNRIYSTSYIFPADPDDVSQIAKPMDYRLEQNYPNPFNPATTISFNNPIQGKVSINVYDVLGHEVATLHNGNLEAGIQNFSFNGADLASGMYLYKVSTANFSDVKRMLLLK
jgi:hypothetical protein